MIMVERELAGRRNKKAPKVFGADSLRQLFSQDSSPPQAHARRPKVKEKEPACELDCLLTAHIHGTSLTKAAGVSILQTVFGRRSEGERARAHLHFFQAGQISWHENNRS
ncbi:MAG: hypothetical protein N3I86_11300 [Verrucomicrobiae bacterium]|nr:hypothetical protein [Verrucomicrobiae bacterium]MDW8309396.1 hypothetical protein [Verrucomicrobiales bacterium]